MAESELSLPKPSPKRTVRTRSAPAKAQEADVIAPEAASTPEPVFEPLSKVEPSPVEVIPEAEPEASSSVRRRRRRSSSTGDGGDSGDE